MTALGAEEIAALVAAGMALVICLRALAGARRWQRFQQGDRKTPPRPAKSEPDDPSRPRGPWDPPPRS